MNDELYQALANNYRREILRLLKTDSMRAGDIAEHFDIKAPSISRHLDVLKRANIVTAQRNYNQIIYSLNKPIAQELLKDIADMLGVDLGAFTNDKNQEDE